MKGIEKFTSFKFLFIILTFSIIVLFYLYSSNIIFVKIVEHGVLLNKIEQEKNFKYNVYINDKLYELETSDKSINIQPGVINFVYRNNSILKFIGYVEPICEKVITKGQTYIELEYSGSFTLSNRANIYSLSGKDIADRSLNSIIVGAKNVKLYKDSKGAVKTAIIDGETDFSIMRIGLKDQAFQGFDHDNLQFISEGGIKIEDKKDGKSITVPPKTKIEVTATEEDITIKLNQETYHLKNRVYILPDDNSSPIKISSFKRGYGFPVYRGFFEITKSSGKLNVINEIEMEKYLYQVVPSEMPSSFGLEALKAQAVAARTYSIAGLLSNAYAEEGFHVDDSTMSQVYNNLQENSLTTRAVNETKGMVMKYDGELVDARYYSTSHGYGANFDEIWSSNGKFPGTKIPYLTAKSYLLNGEQYNLSSEEEANRFFKDWNLKSYDSDSPYFRWKVLFTKDELKNSIEKNLKLLYSAQQNYVLTLTKGEFVSKEVSEKCLGDLIDLVVAKRGGGGNIMELVISGTKGTYKVIKELNVRYILRPRKSDTGFDRDIIINRINSGDIKNSALMPSAFMVFDINKDAANNIKDITFYGGGYGHSVGLSQYGAKYFSTKGYIYDKILKIYYNGITVEKLY